MMFELYKQNQQKKLGLVSHNESQQETIDKRIILYRFLGHFEIRNGHQWKIDTS